jgi:cellulose 1,4-beta-cellobiosidase
MAGIATTSQTSLHVSAETDYALRSSQISITGSFTTSYKLLASQAAITASVYTNYRLRSSQAAILAWVITCESSSYVPPAAEGAVTLVAVARSPDSGEIHLSWTALSGFTYDLFRGTTPGGEDSTPIATGLTGTSYTDSGLTFHETYYYRVTGTNACGNETGSNEAWAAVTCTLPLTPMGFVAVAGQLPHQVILRWTVLDGMTYEIQRNNVTLASGLTEIPYIDSDVPSGFVQYSLSALNDCGWGEDAAHITIQAPGCTPWSGAVVSCTGWKSRNDDRTPDAVWKPRA